MRWPLASRAASVVAIVLSVGASCGARSAASLQAPSKGREIVLAPGEARFVPDAAATVAFEQVVEDSRCPTGVRCISAGDAAVRIRIEIQGSPPARHVLHTNVGSAREAQQAGVRVRLVSLAPHPAGDTRPRPEDYRVSLLVEAVTR
jgi:hypothetical protein